METGLRRTHAPLTHGVYRNRTRRAHPAGPLLCLFLALTPACVTNPVTGSSSLNLFSEAEDIQLGSNALAGVVATAPLLQAGPELSMVERIMERITRVSDRPGWPWEVVLIDDPQTMNAFCLPGGKMAVYTGILPICEDPELGLEAGLAVIMGHEIAHAISRHGTSRASLGQLAELGIQEVSGDVQELAALGFQAFVGLPYSRKHEFEADEIGQLYMARAGYDPRAAPRLWERMGNRGGSSSPISGYFSTHPGDLARAAELRAKLPRAQAEYEQSRWR